MHLAPEDQGDLPLHRIVATVAPSADRALLLRMVALLHKRGVPLLELHLERSDGGSPREHPDRMSAVFRATERQAHVVRHGFDALVHVTEVELDLDIDLS